MTETELGLYEAAMELLHSTELEDLAGAMAELEEEAGQHFAIGLDGDGFRVTVEPRADGDEARSLHIMRTRKALAQYVGQGFI